LARFASRVRKRSKEADSCTRKVTNIYYVLNVY
jgi:hypothetical protein